MPWRCSAYPRPSAWTLRRQRKTEELAATGSRLVHPREVQRLREKIEDSVDGRRAIALAVCALLLIGTVFSLGVMIGRKAASVQGPPDVVEANLGPKGTWYRVRVGAFQDKDSANRFRKDVERELRTAAVVMPTH